MANPIGESLSAWLSAVMILFAFRTPKSSSQKTLRVLRPFQIHRIAAETIYPQLWR